MLDEHIVKEELTLYSIADSHDGYDPDSWFIAVWGMSTDHALHYASQIYAVPINLFVIQSATATSVHYEPESFATARPILPCQEQRAEVLRCIGWRDGDEDYCVSCTRAAMGLPEYKVCPDCEECRVCAAKEDPAFQCYCVAEE